MNYFHSAKKKQIFNEIFIDHNNSTSNNGSLFYTLES